MKKTTTATKKCNQCPNPVEMPADDLCAPCSAVLVHMVLDSGPDRSVFHCVVCQGEIRLTEARVLRAVRDHKAGSGETPRLCWVCAHLHLSANAPLVVALPV